MSLIILASQAGGCSCLLAEDSLAAHSTPTDAHVGSEMTVNPEWHCKDPGVNDIPHKYVAPR